MFVTGDKCEKSGLYLSSGSCGHAGQSSHLEGEPLPACRICGKPVHWTLLRPWETPAAMPMSRLSKPENDARSSPGAGPSDERGKTKP